MRGGRERCGEERPARALRGAAFLALATLPAWPLLPRAADLTGRADLTAAQDEAVSSSSEYLRQVYTLDYRRQVSLPISFRLGLRYQDDRGSSVAGVEESRIRSRVLAPTASLDYRLESFGLLLSYRLNDEERIDPDTGATLARSIERWAGSVRAQVVEGGDVALAADRLGFSSATRRTIDDRVGLTFRYTTPAFRLQNENRIQRFEDDRTGFTRISMGPRITAAYSRSFGNGWALAAQYLVDYFRTEQEARSSVPVTIPTEILLAGGLYVLDDLPLDTDPMTPEPRLVDRGFDASAGVSLGPVPGTSFHNLAVDLGRVLSADELRVHVRSATGAPVPFGGPVSFAAYSSQDGLRWAAADGPATSFDPDLSAYVVTFAPVAARFFKVVSFGVNTVDTLVTELQCFVHETFQPDETLVSSAVRQGLGLVLSAKPWPRVSLGYSGQLNADALSPYRGERTWSTDTSNALHAQLGPFGPYRLEARQTHTWARQPRGFSQSSLASAALARFQPIARLELGLDARRTEDRVERELPTRLSIRSVTWAASLESRVALYESLSLSASAGVNRQSLAGGGTTDYLIGGLRAEARLRRDLDLRLDVTAQRVFSRRGDTSAQLAFPLLRVTGYELYVAEATYRPSAQLSLMARAGYAVSGATDGIVQVYRASWLPFPGGAVQLAFDYGEEIDPLTGQSFRRASASPRWDVNRHAVLQLSYNMVRGSGALPVRQESVYVTLTLKT